LKRIGRLLTEKKNALLRRSLQPSKNGTVIISLAVKMKCRSVRKNQNGNVVEWLSSTPIISASAFGDTVMDEKAQMQEVYTFLRKWWMDHILVEDKIYGELLSSDATDKGT